MHLPLPHLGIGTWGMGGKYERDDTTINASLSSLTLGLSLGLRTIDTAELYGAGLCETIVGQAIAGTKREDIHLISKVWKTNLHYDDVLRAAEGSLTRLKTSYLDLYLVHWPSDTIPILETMQAMERLLNEGMVRAIGVSNFSVPALETAQQALTGARLSAHQFGYNVLHQESQEMVIYCKSHDIDVIAYRPLAQGNIPNAHNPVIKELAQRYGRTENQIALNWLITQGTFPIPATLNLVHMQENARAVDFMLSPEDSQRLCQS